MIWLLLSLFLAIQVVDVVTTAKAFKLGGEEAMPVPRFLMNTIGIWPTFIGLKLLMVGLGIAAVLFVKNGWIFTAILTAIGLFVVYNNVSWLQKDKSSRTPDRDL